MAEPQTLSFRAMGSPCRIVVQGGPTGLANRARELVDGLEQRWSRFLPTSEISALNRVSSAVTVVSEETYTLVGNAVRAQQLTQGWFNPLMLKQLEQHGYDRPWSDDDPPVPASGQVEAGSAEAIELYPEISAVRLPAGSCFDPGGIGKGMAVDLAVVACIEAGATTVAVELGGDLRVHGDPWYGPRWEIAVADPHDRGRDIATFTPSAGAVATSTTMRRRWFDGDRTLHHLIDPFTGHPSSSPIVSVTTCSSMTWWAEVAAKAALLAGPDRVVDLLDALAAPGIAVTKFGEVLRTPGQPKLVSRPASYAVGAQR